MPPTSPQPRNAISLNDDYSASSSSTSPIPSRRARAHRQSHAASCQQALFCPRFGTPKWSRNGRRARRWGEIYPLPAALGRCASCRFRPRSRRLDFGEGCSCSATGGPRPMTLHQSCIMHHRPGSRSRVDGSDIDQFNGAAVRLIVSNCNCNFGWGRPAGRVGGSKLHHVQIRGSRLEIWGLKVNIHTGCRSDWNWARYLDAFAYQGFKFQN